MSAVYFFLSYYIAVNITGVSYFTLVGFHLSAFDIITLFWIIYFFYNNLFIKFFKYMISIYFILKNEILIIFIFLIYAVFACIKGAYYPKNIAMYLQLLRDVLIMFMGIYFMKDLNIIKLNRYIVKFSFYFGIVMLFLLFINLFFNSTLINVFEWGEEFKHNLYFIRFKGLSGDPNFYAFLISLALFITVYNKFKYKYLYIIVFIIMLLFTFSRSVLCSIIISFIIMFILNKNYFNLNIKKLVIFSVVIALTGILCLYLPIIDNLTLFDLMRLRIEKGSPRFIMWEILWQHFLTHPLFGYGMRYSEYFIKGVTNTHFAHNSYLELLVEYGLIGFLLFIFFIKNIFVKILKLTKYKNYLPWIQIFIVLIIMFGAFTIMYWPFDWIIYSILLGGYVNVKNRYYNYKL